MKEKQKQLLSKRAGILISIKACKSKLSIDKMGSSKHMFFTGIRQSQEIK